MTFFSCFAARYATRTVAEMIMKIARVEHESVSSDSPRMCREHKAQGFAINGANDQIIWAAGAGRMAIIHSIGIRSSRTMINRMLRTTILNSAAPRCCVDNLERRKAAFSMKSV